MQQYEAEWAVAKAGVIRDDAAEAGEECGQGAFAEEEDEGDGGCDEVGESGEQGVAEPRGGWVAGLRIAVGLSHCGDSDR